MQAEYKIVSIAGERAATEYLVFWSGVDAAGHSWRPTWEPGSNLVDTAALVEYLEETK